MSVDGELLTDILRHALAWSLPAYHRNVAVFAVTGPDGAGRSTVLRNVLSATRDAATHTLNLGEALMVEPAQRPYKVVFVVADYYSIAQWSPQRNPLPRGSMVALVVDDILCVSRLLYNNDNDRIETLMQELCAVGGVLVTTAGEAAQLPSYVERCAAVLLRYPVPRVVSSAACYRQLCCAGLSGQDSDSLAKIVQKQPTARILGAAAEAFHLQSTLPMDHNEDPTLDQCVSCMEKFRASDVDASMPLLRRVSPLVSPTLFGLEQLASRLEMLCRIHLASHTGNDDITAQYCPGQVARRSTATTGVLLHGPTGCGKTSLIQMLASRAPSVSMLSVHGSSLYAKYLGESEERLRRVFTESRALAPCVLVIEDIDVLAVSRKSADATGGTGVDVTKRMLAALLCEMDGVTGNEGVLVIGTTNHPHGIDQALLRQGRLETLLFVPPLDATAIKAMTSSFLGGTVDDDTVRVCCDAAASQCCGCTAVGLQFLFRYVVEALGGHDDDQHALSPNLWDQCIRACAEQLAPPLYSWKP